MFKHEKKKQKNIQIQYLSVSDLWINTLMMGEDGIMVALFPGGPLERGMNPGNQFNHQMMTLKTPEVRSVVLMSEA